MLGLSLVLEEVGQEASPADPSPAPPHLTLPPSHPPPSPLAHKAPATLSVGSRTSKTSLTSSSSSQRGSNKVVPGEHSSHSQLPPLERVKVLKEFLTLSLQLEVLRYIHTQWIPEIGKPRQKGHLTNQDTSPIRTPH